MEAQILDELLGTSQEEIEGFEYDSEDKHEGENRGNNQTLEQHDFNPNEQEHTMKKSQLRCLSRNTIAVLMKRKTLRLRHSVAKFLAPNVFKSVESYSEVIDRIPRPMTMMLKEHFSGSKKLTGAEIGVAKGENALSILQILPMRRIYLIDPYAPYSRDRQKSTISGFHSTPLTNCYKHAVLKLSGFKQAIFVKKSSEEAVSEIRETLDFVYIDGNHDYSHVRNDINLYYPFVKDNGVIGGHDYHPECAGLRKAVDDFVKENNLSLRLSFPDWWVLKIP